MNEILEQSHLAEGVYELWIAAPEIARARKPGQFAMLQLDRGFGERIPLTIADSDGESIADIARMEAGARIDSVLGPLGNPTRAELFGEVACVGGGIGVAPLLPIAGAMKDAGNRVVVVEGARSKDLVILEERMRAIADVFILMTDDGSAGRKGLVTEALRELCRGGAGGTPAPDLVVGIGPPAMMKRCAETRRPFGVPTVVSLNTIMVDGTGMCGDCRVTVGGRRSPSAWTGRNSTATRWTSTT